MRLPDSTGLWSQSSILVEPRVPVDLFTQVAGNIGLPYAAFQSAGASPFAALAQPAAAQSYWGTIGIFGVSGLGVFDARTVQAAAPEFGFELGSIGMNTSFSGNYGGGIVALNTISGIHPFFEVPLIAEKALLAYEQFSFDSASDMNGVPFHATGEPGPGSAPAPVAGGSIGGPSVPPGEIAAVIGMTASSAQALGVAARGMPNVSHVAGQLTSSASQAATSETGTFAGSGALNWGVTVITSAQRQDGQDPATSMSDPAQGSLAGRSLASSSSAVTGAPLNSDVEGPVPAVVTDGTVLWAPDQGVPAINVAVDTPSSASGGFVFRITAGPLVSRNAGPLGPILASVGGDPTPEVDRNERALHHEIERGDLDAGGNPGHQGYDWAGTESGADDWSGSAGPVMAISGPGGFQLKVTALSKRRRTDLSELVSAIPTTGEPEGGLLIDSAQVAAASEASNRDETPGFAKFVKAACVLALGVGMSSQVLFPNMLASIRRRIPRLLVHRKSHARKS
jgi:hypothetical protein